VSRARGLMSNQAAGGFDDEAEETEGGGHLYRPADSIIASFQGPCLVMYVPGRHDPNWDGVVDGTDTCTAPASWTRHLFCLWAGFLLGPSRDRVAHRKRNKLLWFCRQLVPPLQLSLLQKHKLNFLIRVHNCSWTDTTYYYYSIVFTVLLATTGPDQGQASCNVTRFPVSTK
jgi:hypothetical protein